MLVARRDPFHPGAQDNSHSDIDIGPRPARAPRLARAMSALQMFGTLLAIPLGIGSGYTMYRANFSPEATCQSLRASIVSMLDKNVDAHTRHTLVRHAVVASEQSCGGVDPDATAAFKSILASEQTAATGARRVEAKPMSERPLDTKSVGEKPKEAARKAEPQQEAAPRQAVAEPKAPQRDAAVSDAAWLAAVRGALTVNDAVPTPPARIDTAVANPAPIAPPETRTVVLGARPKAELRATLPSPEPAIVAPPQAAPALPPPATITTAPAPRQDAEHPVPPASIPEQPAPIQNDVVAAQHEPSRLGAFIGQIPLVGKLIEPK